MNILFFDTETTGLPIWGAPPSAEGQPRLVQLGCILADHTGRVIHEIGLIRNPKHIEIPEEASRIHGITQDLAIRDGLPVGQILDLFQTISNSATLLVCHNVKFDKLILDVECILDDCQIKELPTYCTMLSSTAICKMRQSNGRAKWPKLAEAYQFFFGEELPNAHRALDDVRGCMRLFFELAKHDPKHPLFKDNWIKNPEYDKYPDTKLLAHKDTFKTIKAGPPPQPALTIIQESGNNASGQYPLIVNQTSLREEQV